MSPYAGWSSHRPGRNRADARGAMQRWLRHDRCRRATELDGQTPPVGGPPDIAGQKKNRNTTETEVRLAIRRLSAFARRSAASVRATQSHLLSQLRLLFCMNGTSRSRHWHRCHCFENCSDNYWLRLFIITFTIVTTEVG
jgi:hypothetical protein